MIRLVIVDKHVRIIPVKHSNTSGFTGKIILIHEPIERDQMKLKINTLVTTIVSLFLLSACGLKGPLYQTPEPQTPSSEKKPAEQPQKSSKKQLSE